MEQKPLPIMTSTKAAETIDQIRDFYDNQPLPCALLSVLGPGALLKLVTEDARLLASEASFFTLPNGMLLLQHYVPNEHSLGVSARTVSSEAMQALGGFVAGVSLPVLEVGSRAAETHTELKVTLMAPNMPTAMSTARDIADAYPAEEHTPYGRVHGYKLLLPAGFTLNLEVAAQSL